MSSVLQIKFLFKALVILTIIILPILFISYSGKYYNLDFYKKSIESIALAKINEILHLTDDKDVHTGTHYGVSDVLVPTWATAPSSLASRLGDFPDFSFVINSATCSSEPVYALLLVGSHPDHRDMRDVIRLTWGNPQLLSFPFKLIFPFGKLPDAKKQMQLEIESGINGDIVQGNFEDGYHNVTLRDLMAMRWTWQHCPQAKFVVHVDDDMMLDVFGLIEILQKVFPNQSPTEDFMACMYMFVNTTVLRDGRYGLNKTVHPEDTYDAYCSGWLYVLNPAMAHLLDDTALRVTPYWLNDAYITGTLMRAANRKHRRMAIRWTMKVNDTRVMATNWSAKNDTPPPYQIGPQDIDLNLTLHLHTQFRQYAMAHLIPKLVNVR